MDATELKVGNWVLAPRSLTDKIQIPDIPYMIKGMLGHIYLDVSPHLEASYRVPPSHLAGIKLDDTWLKKLGFSEQSVGVYQRGKGVLYLSKEGFSFAFGLIELDRTVQYVHEVQNIYSALFKEEINIEEDGS